MEEKTEEERIKILETSFEIMKQIVRKTDLSSAKTARKQIELQIVAYLKEHKDDRLLEDAALEAFKKMRILNLEELKEIKNIITSS